ncbi:ATP-binding protein [Celeribacter marinus]|uniref:ATP-binding protein n=1 Tax=Celeribacter marinus TaxID=1397108 RepID=UPI003F6A8003
MNHRITLNASQKSVRKALRALKAQLDDHGRSPDDIAAIELVLAEALNNIVEHAYRGTDQGPIEVALSIDANGLAFRITDRGLPMPDGEPPKGSLAPMTDDISELPEGGFGWFLIHELAHDLAYVRRGSSNIFSFSIRAADTTA